jgi:hypothetical protein
MHDDDDVLLVGSARYVLPHRRKWGSEVNFQPILRAFDSETYDAIQSYRVTNDALKGRIEALGNK